MYVKSDFWTCKTTSNVDKIIVGIAAKQEGLHDNYGSKVSTL